MRFRLISVAAAITSMVALAFLVPLAILTRDLVADRAIASAERAAASVARVLVLVPASDGSAASALAATDVGDIPVTIVGPEGSTVGAPLDPDEDLGPALDGATFRQPVEGGEAVYVPVVTQSGTFVVRALATDEAMTSGVLRTWAVLGGLGIILVGIGIVAADRLGRSLVRPVEELSAAAVRLGQGDLDARVEPDGPEELRSVGEAFNELAVQVDDLLQTEREQVADLAHRLRTPLTGARLAAESIRDPDVRERTLGSLDALQREVDHLIDEARRPDRRRSQRWSDAAVVVSGRVDFWRPLAEDEDRSLDAVIGDPPMTVAVPERDLAATVDALIGNVFAHTPSGTDLRVELSCDDHLVVLSVDDSGPGIADDVDVIRRGTSGSASTGLGLDIARRMAESAGGGVRVGRSDLGGASVRVTMPEAVERRQVGRSTAAV